MIHPAVGAGVVVVVGRPEVGTSESQQRPHCTMRWVGYDIVLLVGWDVDECEW